MIITNLNAGMNGNQFYCLNFVEHLKAIRMKVEIWSDIVCPFCYIGKRNFEAALKQFNERENITITWKSFQLDPTTPESSTETVYEYLANRKGISLVQSEQMHAHVVETAAKAGLTYRFDLAKVANTMKAHCLLQLAKTKGLGDETKEQLLHAYFSGGENIGSDDVLISIGKEVGLDANEVKDSLYSDDFRRAVNADIQEAQNLGVTGVPFFVLDRKYGISGAQPIEHMLATLEKAYSEWNEEKKTTTLDMSSGESCEIDGDCI